MTIDTPIKTILSVDGRDRSTQTVEAVRRALECALSLDERSCGVESIEIHAAHPVIGIHRPGKFMHGSIHVVRIHRHSRETVYVTRMMGCQVQWSVFDCPDRMRRA